MREFQVLIKAPAEEQIVVMKLFALSIVFVLFSGRPIDSYEQITDTISGVKSNKNNNNVSKEPQIIRSFNPSPIRVTTPTPQTIASGFTSERVTNPDIARFADQSKLLLTMNKRMTVLPVQESIGGQISLEDKQSLTAVVNEDKISRSLSSQSEQLLQHLQKYSNIATNNDKQSTNAPTTTTTTTTTTRTPTTTTPTSSGSKAIKQEEVMNLLLSELPMLDIKLNGDDRVNNVDRLRRQQQLQPGLATQTGNRAPSASDRRQDNNASQTRSNTQQLVDLRSHVNKTTQGVDRNTNSRKRARTPCFFNAITCT